MCCAGSRLLVQESIYEPVIEKLKRRLTTLRVGDPRQEHRRRRDQLEQLEKIEELVRGEEEGAEIYQPPCRLPEKGYWFVPTVSPTSRRATDRAGGDLRPRPLGADFRTPDEAVEKANNTPCRFAGCWTEKVHGSFRWRAGSRPASSGRTPTTASIRPRRSAATKSGRPQGGLHELEPYLDLEESEVRR